MIARKVILSLDAVKLGELRGQDELKQILNKLKTDQAKYYYIRNLFKALQGREFTASGFDKLVQLILPLVEKPFQSDFYEFLLKWVLLNRICDQADELRQDLALPTLIQKYLLVCQRFGNCTKLPEIFQRFRPL